MALQIRRGLQNELDTITPLEGEPIWVTDQEKLVIGDGITQGGINVTQNLQDLRVTSAGVKTSLYDAASTGTIALINGTNSFELAVNSTGTHITGPLYVSTTASVTTLRFADGSVQTTADTANYDQSLNTTDRVTFAGMTLTNIATLSTSSVRFNWPGNTNYYILQLEDYGIRLTQGSVYGPNDSDTQIITGGGTPSTANERNAAVVLKNGSTPIANFNTSTFTIYRNGEQSLYSNTLGTLTLGNGSDATNIASASDTDLSLGSPQNTHNILLSTTEAKIRGKNSVEIITMTTSTTEFKAGGTTQASVRTGGFHIDNGYINGSGNGIIVQNYNGQPLVFKDNTSGNLKTLASFSSSTIEMGVLGQGSILINGTNDVTFGSGFSAGTGGFQLGNSQNQPFKFGNYNSGQSYSLGVSTSGANVYGPNAENLAEFSTSTATINTNLVVNGDITANKLTIQYTTVTTTIVETDDIIKTTNATAAGSGVGAIVATGGISAGSGFYTANTSTFGYATLGPNNSAVSPTNVTADAENMLYFNNNQGGSLIFRQRQSPTIYRNFTIARTGNLIMDSGATISNGLSANGEINIRGYINTSTNVAGTVSLGTNGSEGYYEANTNGIVIGTYGDAKTITLQCGTDAGTIQAATVSTTTFNISVPASITTATITYTNVSTNGQIQSQATAGFTAATVVFSMPIATYRSGRLQCQFSDGTNYHTIDCNVLHDGTNTYNNQTELYSSSLGTLSVAINGANLEATFTPTAGTITAKVIGTLVAV